MTGYRVWFAVEVDADSPEEAAGAAKVEVALGAYEFQRTEEIE